MLNLLVGGESARWALLNYAELFLLEHNGHPLPFCTSRSPHSSVNVLPFKSVPVSVLFVKLP